MKSYDQAFGKRAAAVILSLATMAVLPACEKGLMLKDPKITAPDFSLETQAPKQTTGTTESFLIYVQGAQVTTTATEAKKADGTQTAADALQTNFKGSLFFKIGTETEDTDAANEANARQIELNIDLPVNATKNTVGRIQNQKGEPEMFYNARCVGDNCEKFYVSVTFDFKDDKNITQDMKVLTVGVYRESNKVKRAIFEFDENAASLSKQVARLEGLSDDETLMPQAGAQEDETKKATDENTAPEAQTEQTEEQKAEAQAAANATEMKVATEAGVATENQDQVNLAQQPGDATTIKMTAQEGEQKSLNAEDANGNKISVNINGSDEGAE